MAAARKEAQPSAREPVRGGRVYKGRPPHQRKRERRDRILEAALDLFGTQGYATTSIEQICAKAHVGIRSLYEEFGDRESVLRELYDRIAEAALEELQDAQLKAASDSVHERALAAISATLHSLLDDPRRGRVLIMESNGVNNALDLHRNRTMRRFAAATVSILPPESAAAMNVRLWALVVAGGINEVIIDTLVRGATPDLDDLARELTEIFERTVAAP